MQIEGKGCGVNGGFEMVREWLLPSRGVRCEVLLVVDYCYWVADLHGAREAVDE